MPHEPISLTKALPEPARATRIVQAALRAYCKSDADTFEAVTPDGMLVRVTRDGWIICEMEKADGK
jgi:hypothetical protein